MSLKGLSSVIIAQENVKCFEMPQPIYAHSLVEGFSTLMTPYISHRFSIDPSLVQYILATLSPPSPLPKILSQSISSLEKRKPPRDNNQTGQNKVQ